MTKDTACSGSTSSRRLLLQTVQSTRDAWKQHLLRTQPRGRDTLAEEPGTEAFTRSHLAAAAQGARAGGEGENSFSVYPLIGRRRRRLNGDQETV